MPYRYFSYTGITFRNNRPATLKARTKFIIYVILLMTCIFFIGAHFQLKQLRKSEEAQLKTRVMADASMLATACVSENGLQSLHQLERLAQGYLVQPLYLTVLIHDNRQYQLVNMAKNQASTPEPFMFSKEIVGAQNQVVLGRATLTYNQDTVEKSVRAARRQLTMLYLLILNGIALPWAWFSSALDRTYHQVINTLKQVDEGNLKSRIDLRSGAGLRDVARYFNQMLDSIEKSNSQLQVYVSKLAEKNMEMSREAVVRKNAERIAQQNEKKFRMIFDQSVQLICLIEPGGGILDTNDAMQDLLQNAKEQVLKTPFSTLPIWKSSSETDAIEQAVLRAQSGNNSQLEMILTAPDDEELTFDFSFKPVLDDKGKVGMIIAEGRDVSARVQAEIALEETEAQVRQSQKMEAIGRLAGGIAHDFNNLLTSILGFSNIVMDELDPEVQGDCRDDLQEVIFAAEKARGLTQKLLMLARKKVYHVEPIHLNEMLNQMKKIIQISLHSDIELITDFDRDIDYIEADSVSLEQIIINLAVNAKDAMPRAGRLYVTTKAVTLKESFCKKNGGNASPGKFVRLSVRDTGSGIPTEVIEHIFEPFYTTKEPGKGTGLGLATVYGLVQQFHGVITVVSKPSEGTEFRIYLPQIEFEPTSMITEAIKKEVPHGTETILLVEDETAVRKLGVRMVESLGYKTLVAHDGEHALEIYEAHANDIDLVLTDVVMPRVTGPELVKKLRTLSPEMKFLYVSGFTRDKLLTHGADEDDAPILQKPYNCAQLGIMIREVLDESNAQKHQIAN